MNKKWIIKGELPADWATRFPDMPQVVAQLLYNRDLESKELAEEFLNPDYVKHTHDPFMFRDMQKAVERIWQAIKDKQKIVVHGDYDCDGVSSSVILCDTLVAMGASVKVYIPHREKEGYGLNKETVEELAKKGTNLIITTDCGISNYEEVNLANSKSIDVIITDHHEPPEILPDALAIINPFVKGETYPFKQLSGGGVAFKLAAALYRTAGRYSGLSFPEGSEKWYLDLVAISTVADIMPLLRENRVLVKYGLMVLKKTKRLGLKALIEQIGTPREKIDAYTIGFQIAPRINAAGRMDHANQAFNLLRAGTEKEASAMASGLQGNNTDRQKKTETLLKEIKSQIGVWKKEDTVIFCQGENWPQGVIGLAAGKIADEYYRPALVMTGTADGKIVGSGRSIPEFNIVNALSKLKKYFERWGGHSQACGFTLKNGAGIIEKFRNDFKKIADEEIGNMDLMPCLEIDAEVKLADLDWKVSEMLECFSPFGKENPKPLFCVHGAIIAGWQRLGSDGKHLRLMVSQGSGRVYKTIGFGRGDFCDNIKVGEVVDLVFEMGVNEWNGNRELEFKIIDLKKNNKHD